MEGTELASLPGRTAAALDPADPVAAAGRGINLVWWVISLLVHKMFLL